MSLASVTLAQIKVAHPLLKLRKRLADELAEVTAKLDGFGEEKLPKRRGKVSAATRAKMSVAHKRRWAKAKKRPF